MAEDDFYQEEFFPIGEKKKLMKKTPIAKRKASDHLAKEDFLLPDMAEL